MKKRQVDSFKMFWLIIGIIGAITFVGTGASVLGNPNCVSVDFSGGRVVTLTCHPDSSGAFSQTSAGWISILGGLALLFFIFRLPIVRFIETSRRPKIHNSSESTHKETKGDKEKVCDSCLNIVPVFSSQCKNCNGNSFTYRKSEYVGNTSQLPSQFVGAEKSDSEFVLINESSSRNCPYCAEIIASQAIKCKHCGSDLRPSASEKFGKFVKTPKGMAILLILTVFTFGVLGSIQQYQANSAEMSALKLNGKICVTIDNLSKTDLGCTNYPYLDISFCSSAKVLMPYWPDLKDSPNFLVDGSNSANRIEGVYGGTGNRYCDTSSKLPYLHRLKGKIDFKVGSYSLRSLTYAELNSTNLDSENLAAGNFLVQVKLK